MFGHYVLPLIKSGEKCMYSSLIVISLNSSHRLYFNEYVFSLPIATGFGDPHMVTLDEKPFTFNGYGEYFILKVKGVDFTLQGRMEPLLADDGSPSKATVYTAFAAKENGSDVVQVRKIWEIQKNIYIYIYVVMGHTRVHI